MTGCDEHDFGVDLHCLYPSTKTLENVGRGSGLANGFTVGVVEKGGLYFIIRRVPGETYERFVVSEVPEVLKGSISREKEVLDGEWVSFIIFTQGMALEVGGI